MSFQLFDMILSGIAYVIMVYFIMRMLRHRNRRTGGDDESDGGVPNQLLPDLDLPPGVTLPDNSPVIKKKEAEEVLV